MASEHKPSKPGPQEGQTHSLAELTRLSPESVQLLKARWVDTVEGFVGMTASGDGKEASQRLLGIDRGQLDSVLEEAEAILGKEAFVKYSTPTPGGPTGVILTEEQRRDMGLT